MANYFAGLRQSLLTEIWKQCLNSSKTAADSPPYFRLPLLPQMAECVSLQKRLQARTWNKGLLCFHHHNCYYFLESAKVENLHNSKLRRILARFDPQRYKVKIRRMAHTFSFIQQRLSSLRRSHFVYYLLRPRPFPVVINHCIIASLKFEGSRRWSWRCTESRVVCIANL